MLPILLPKNAQGRMEPGSSAPGGFLPWGKIGKTLGWGEDSWGR
jgi:hypothetical protein